MPTPYSEIAGGVISNKLYILGFATNRTAIYNLATATYCPSVQRDRILTTIIAPTFTTANSTCSARKTIMAGAGEIYNPTNDTLTTGTTAPYLFGAAASALINGEIYVAGGMATWSTTDQAAKYTPANNSWTTLPKMPKGAHHTAGGTDGYKLYVFGGRAGAAGSIENGFNTVQIFDPATGTWASSDNPASGIAPMPIGRSGTQKAPFYNGEFYIVGGETLNYRERQMEFLHVSTFTIRA